MKNRYYSLLTLGAVLGLAVAAGADVVVLDDGTQLQGTVVRKGAFWELTKDNGAVVQIDPSKVDSIEVGASHTTSSAQEQLASLRRSVSYLNDIPQILTRYQAFIAHTDNSDIQAQAQKDMEDWRDRLDQGMVKLGDKWMTAAQRESRRKVARSEVLAARDLLRANHDRDAEPIITQALADDPDSAEAKFLQGVLAFKRSELEQAHEDFDSANQLLPNSGPILNNLGVIASKHHAWLDAANFYAQAMAADPDTHEILDNVAELLHSVPDEDRTAPIIKQATDLFQRQDSQVQKTMANDGWFRWGATWVSAAEMQQIKAQQSSVQQHVDDLQAQHGAIQAKVDSLNAEITRDYAELQRMDESTGTLSSQNYRPILVPRPEAYGPLADRAKQLVDERDALLGQVSSLNDQIRQARQGAPNSGFVGVQRIIGASAVPLPNDQAYQNQTEPATTTQPS